MQFKNDYKPAQAQKRKFFCMFSLLVHNTVICHSAKEIRFEKSITRQFHHCANIKECTSQIKTAQHQ